MPDGSSFKFEWCTPLVNGFAKRLLHCALAAAQCIVIWSCLWVGVLVGIDVKKRFLRFLFRARFFTFFNVFYFANVFYF